MKGEFPNEVPHWLDFTTWRFLWFALFVNKLVMVSFKNKREICYLNRSLDLVANWEENGLRECKVVFVFRLIWKDSIFHVKELLYLILNHFITV